MKKYLSIIVLLNLITALSCQQKNVSTNSQWRGEGRDGMYNDTGLLKEWPAEGPQLLWYYEGLNEGFTSAAIAGNRIYVTGLLDDGLMVYVLDMTGQLLIAKEIGKEWDQGRNGTRSTACVNDGKVYVYSALGTLYCLDELTLDEVWSKDLLADFEGENIPWGVTESPLIVGEKIVMTPGGKTHNMVALNKHTGDLIWTSPGEGTISAYCSPQYIEYEGVCMVVTSTFAHIIAWDIHTGEKLWSYPRTSKYDNHPNTPLYHNGMIFSPTGDGGGSLMLRLVDGGKAVEKVWENLEMDTQMGGAVRIGNYIYGSGHLNRYWFCLDWNTGETKYKERENTPCSVISADGMLYCYTEKGEMNLVKPNPEKFEPVSSFKVTLGTDTHWAHPVIHEGILYIRHGDALMAYKIKK